MFFHPPLMISETNQAQYSLRKTNKRKVRGEGDMDQTNTEQTN